MRDLFIILRNVFIGEIVELDIKMAEERFRLYKWDSDHWKQYKENLMFPDGADENELLQKSKIRYYNQYVEPYTPEIAPQTHPRTETHPVNPQNNPSMLVFTSLLLNLFVFITAAISLFTDHFYSRCLIAALVSFIVALIRTQTVGILQNLIFKISFGILLRLSKIQEGQHIFLIVAHMFVPRESSNFHHSHLVLCIILMMGSLLRLNVFMAEFLSGMSQNLARYPIAHSF